MTVESLNDDVQSDESQDNDGPKCSHWFDDRGYEFVGDTAGEIVNIARLTAYAEYGDAIHGGHAHHEIPELKVTAPKFLDVLPPTEHLQLAHGEREVVDGFPLVRAGP